MMIETLDLTKVYRLGKAEVHALQGVSLSAEAGDFVALTGASGSGKTTLLHLLGCLDTPTRGRYLLDGTDVGSLSKDARARMRNKRIGFVFQTFNLLPRLSALENVTLPLLYQPRATAVRERATEALDRVGLVHRLHHKPTELSGGQQQRVAIARALVTDPALLLADEPTGNLDSATGEEVMHLLTELNRAGHTLVLVTHDPHVAGYARRILRLRDGRLVDGATPAEETGLVAHSLEELTRVGD
jgi:putative ABC transport system ATP-binding protein